MAKRRRSGICEVCRCTSKRSESIYHRVVAIVAGKAINGTITIFTQFSVPVYSVDFSLHDPIYRMAICEKNTSKDITI